MRVRTPRVPRVPGHPCLVRHTLFQPDDRAVVVTGPRVGHPAPWVPDDACPCALNWPSTPTTEVPEDPLMLADDDLQSMYALAHFLHPAPEVAWAVTLEAAERFALLGRLQGSRPRPSWWRLPAACRPQYCVYLASDPCERAHEGLQPSDDSRRQPTPDDYLVRYLKCLVWWTMTESACHVALALGCFLYRYPPDAIAQLSPVLCAQQDILRICVRLAHQLQARFSHVHLFDTDQDMLRTRLPTAHDRQLLQQALTRFTPWGTAHVPAPPRGRSMRDTHFDGAPSRFDWDRIHALLEPASAGLPRLIRDYNQQLPTRSARRLADPDDMLAIPRFLP
jgi:hypothetical protein